MYFMTFYQNSYLFFRFASEPVAASQQTQIYFQLSFALILLVMEPVVYSIQVVIFSQCFIKIAVIDDLNNNAITLKYQS